MNKLPVLTQREMLERLREHGFEWVRSKGSHRILFDGVRHVTVPADLSSHGTTHQVIRQAGLTVEAFQKQKPSKR